MAPNPASCVLVTENSYTQFPELTQCHVGNRKGDINLKTSLKGSLDEQASTFPIANYRGRLVAGKTAVLGRLNAYNRERETVGT